MRAVVGAHLDDAVLGAGGYLAHAHEPVVTVFDGAPTEPGLLTPYDGACGFGSSAEAMGARRAENDRALGYVGCLVHLGLGMPEVQYEAERPHLVEVAEAIDAAMCDLGAEGLVGPLGIQHPDHVLVGDAVLWLARHRATPVWLYEELPYRVAWPELAAVRLEEVRDRGWHLVPDFLGDGGAEAKEAAVGAYESQGLDVHCCLVPERFWAVSP